MEFTRTVKKLLCILFSALMSSVKVSDSNDGQQTDDGYNCNDKGRDRYFVGSLQFLNWTSANEICKSQNASLLFIQDKYEQNAFEAYLKRPHSNASKIQDIWMSGKMETLSQWTWINDQTPDNENIISPQLNMTRTHAMLRRGPNFTAEPPSNNAWYLCQYYDGHSRSHCSNNRSVTLTNSCLIPSEYGNTSWYEARNECRAKGGDLAVLTHRQDQQILKNHTFPQPNYWIGLRRVRWVWITDIGNIEVKYTKWQAKVGYPDSRDFCISANASNGNWRPSSCSRSFSVVCDKCERITTSSTISSVTDKSTANEYTQSSGLIYGVTTAGVIIIIVCIIIIVVAVWRTSKSSNKKEKPKRIEAKTEEVVPRVKSAAVEPPTAAGGGGGGGEAGGVYADIALADKTTLDREKEAAAAAEGHQPPQGIVYAALEFDQRPTTNSRDDADGPLYAEPSKMTTGNTKIGPMGDAYTLPSSSVTHASTDMMTQGPIYANSSS